MSERTFIHLTGVVCALLASVATTASAQTSVCVDIELRSWSETDRERPEGERDTDAEGKGDTEAEADTDTEAGTTAPADEEFSDDELGGLVDDTRSRAATTSAMARGQRRGAPAATSNLAHGSGPRPPGSRVEPSFYLRRLVEHYVTHRPGYESVREGCEQRITIELYPLAEGWTAFARYTGHAREEKVDHVRLDELDALAHRLSDALLRDVSIDETLTRRTVLRADSEGDLRKIRGGTGFLLSIGTSMYLGELPTAPNSEDPAVEEIRFYAPLAINLGLRSAYRAWGLDAYLGMQIGTQRRASTRNLGGGHADYTFGALAALHFHRYLRPAEVNSFYLGGGARFGVDRYRIIAPRTDRGQPGPDGAWGGGMNVDLLVGHEFMRASALHFFVELDVSLPAYLFESGNELGRIDSWLPSALVHIGLLH